MFFLCYSLTCHENPLEIFPYGDPPPPLPTGKLGKLTHLPPGKSDPFRGGVWIFSGTTDSHECSVEQLFNKMSFDRQILLAIQFIELECLSWIFLKRIGKSYDYGAPPHWRFRKHDRWAPREKGLCSELSGANI